MAAYHNVSVPTHSVMHQLRTNSALLLFATLYNCTPMITANWNSRSLDDVHALISRETCSTLVVVAVVAAQGLSKKKWVSNFHTSSSPFASDRNESVIDRGGNTHRKRCSQVVCRCVTFKDRKRKYKQTGNFSLFSRDTFS